MSKIVKSYECWVKIGDLAEKYGEIMSVLGGDFGCSLQETLEIVRAKELHIRECLDFGQIVFSAIHDMRNRGLNVYAETPEWLQVPEFLRISLGYALPEWLLVYRTHSRNTEITVRPGHLEDEAVIRLDLLEGSSLLPGGKHAWRIEGITGMGFGDLEDE